MGGGATNVLPGRAPLQRPRLVGQLRVLHMQRPAHGLALPVRQNFGCTPSDVAISGPDTDTLSVNDTTFAFDNFHAMTNYDVDIFSDGLGSHTHEVLLTDPGVFQLGVDDVDGVRTFIDSFTPADFINPDIGLADLGG
jgi:hypothetical protein